MTFLPINETSGVHWPVLPGFLTGLIAAGFAILAIVKERERSVIAFLSPILLLLLVFFGTRQT